MKDEFSLEKIRANTINHDDFMQKWLKESSSQNIWLEAALEEYANSGDFDAFFRALNYVIKARGYGAVTKLAKELKMDRSNLSNIINGKVTPSACTVFKLLNGLGYKIQIKSA